jgi:hypothetical protein
VLILAKLLQFVHFSYKYAELLVDACGGCATGLFLKLKKPLARVFTAQTAIYSIAQEAR